MRTYERVWRGSWFVVTAIGLVLAMLQWSAVGVVVTLVALVGLCSFGRHVLLDAIPEAEPRVGARRAFSQSLALSMGVVTVWSFGRVTPALALLLVLTAAVSSPTVVRRVIRSTGGSPASAPLVATRDPRAPAPRVSDEDAEAALTQPEELGPLVGLDDGQLCRVWRESFWALREPVPAETVLRLVALREACLDELERRDADALRAWLDSGARASSGPEKYLDRPGREEAA